jgi:hypothetical protein
MRSDPPVSKRGRALTSAALVMAIAGFLLVAVQATGPTPTALGQSCADWDVKLEGLGDAGSQTTFSVGFNTTTGTATGTSGTVKIEGDTTFSGQTVLGICVKAGDQTFGVIGSAGTFGDGCYSVSGIGGTTLTVTRLDGGPECKGISNIQLLLGGTVVVSPTIPPATPTTAPPAATPTAVPPTATATVVPPTATGTVAPPAATITPVPPALTHTPGPAARVTICHVAGNGNMIEITVSENALRGHFNENGTPRQGHEDDILGPCPTPVPPQATPTVVLPTPTVTPEVPAATPTATVVVPTPTATVILPTPTVTPEVPAATPTATVVLPTPTVTPEVPVATPTVILPTPTVVPPGPPVDVPPVTPPGPPPGLPPAAIVELPAVEAEVLGVVVTPPTVVSPAIVPAPAFVAPAVAPTTVGPTALPRTGEGAGASFNWMLAMGVAMILLGGFAYGAARLSERRGR